jgi:hypothetical protein
MCEAVRASASVSAHQDLLANGKVRGFPFMFLLVHLPRHVRLQNTADLPTTSLKRFDMNAPHSEH